MYDVTAENHGTLCLVHPETDAAQDWMENHTDGAWFAGGLVVEPRYIVDLLLGMAADGFAVPLEDNERRERIRV